MATRIKTRADNLYEQDLYAWSRAQADLLRAGRFAELDLEHLIEEIEDVGGSLYREVRSRVRTIMEHLLKLEHSPAAEPRAIWERTIRTQRARPRGRSDARPSPARRTQHRPLLRGARGLKPRRRCALMASMLPPTRSPKAAPTASTR